MHARSLRTVALLAGLTTIGDCRSDRTGRGDAYDAEIAPVVAAVGARRPIEGRLTGGFQYGEWRQVRGRERGLELEAAATRLRESGAGDRARAVGALLGGDSDAAIVGLERILSRPGWSASAASDLAAARLARWRRTGAALDAVRALNDADRAVAAEPGLPEGWFNRALALDALGLAGLAGEGWVRYDGLDPTSAWAAEAADRASRDERRVRASLEALRRGSVLR